MAVTKAPTTSKLVIQVKTGMNGTKEVFKNRSFAGLKTDAADADVFAVGQAIAGLQQYTPAKLHRLDEAELLNQ